MYLPPPPPLPSHLSSSLQLSVCFTQPPLSAFFLPYCCLSASSPAVSSSSHLLPMPTYNPCPPSSIPPLFLTLPHLPFLPGLMSWVYTPSVFKLLFLESFRLSDAVLFPLKTSSLTKCGHKRKNYILNLLSKTEKCCGGREGITT